MEKKEDNRHFKIAQDQSNIHVETPDDLVDELEARFGKFDFDPCPFHSTFDGLKIKWAKLNFVNPPFNLKKKFNT